MMNVLSLFSGIDTGREAFKELGIEIDNYYSSEIEPKAISISKYQHKDIKHIGDVTSIDERMLTFLPKIDWLLNASPCQSFSNLGDGTGFEGKSKLYFEFLRIYKWLKEHNNPNIKLLSENVVMKKEWKDKITTDLQNIDKNVICTKIDAGEFGPGTRNRLYWTNFNINKKYVKDTGVIKDFLEDINDFKPLKQYFINTFGGKQRIEYVKNINQKAACLLASCYKLNDNVHCKNEFNQVHQYSPTECEAIMTMPKDYTKYGINEKGHIKEISTSSRYRCLGNGWNLNVIKYIIENECTKI